MERGATERSAEPMDTTTTSGSIDWKERAARLAHMQSQIADMKVRIKSDIIRVRGDWGFDFKKGRLRFFFNLPVGYRPAVMFVTNSVAAYSL